MTLKNSYAPWTESEERVLGILCNYGASVEIIATTLNRSTGSIKSRLGHLEIGENEMFTHRYIVLGITHNGYVDRLAGLRGTDPREICERALEKAGGSRTKSYKQLVLISIGRDGEIGDSLNIQQHRIESAPPVPQPTYILQPVQAYFG